LTADEVQHGDASATELRVIAFSDAMHELFSCADLVVSRAGAGSIAELIECLAPSILIPYPYAADDHQAANARNLEQRGCSVLVDQEHMGDLYQEVHDLIYSDWMLERMRSNMKRIREKHVAADLAKYLLDHYIGRSGRVDASVKGMFSREEVSHAGS
jgi:UDP-N-acetylglucosamine--N-acetylmuramyl-(pentapeptide) pyrophosphoryl-undecaprenol N-acetylglucosamine transferase